MEPGWGKLEMVGMWEIWNRAGMWEIGNGWIVGGVWDGVRKLLPARGLT